MSDIAPLVLSVIRDKTVVDLTAENDRLSEEVAKLRAERDDLYAIKHGRIEITDTKTKRVLAWGLLPTMRTYSDGFCSVGLLIADELVGGIEAAFEIDICIRTSSPCMPSRRTGQPVRSGFCSMRSP